MCDDVQVQMPEGSEFQTEMGDAGTTGGEGCADLGK